MNTLDTLYFPGTDIHSVRQYPIFLLFQQIHLLTPVEGDPVEGGIESPDSFIKSGFCQVHTPCPLGRDRNRFLHLVEDIKSRKDDYAAQLSSLTLASMSTTNGQTEDSERNIVRSLFTPTERQAQVDEQETAEHLWKARLVLAIGELLDHEEEEIAMQMAMLEEEEKGLFEDLQGEDESHEEDNPFAELTLMKRKMDGIHAGNVKKRFTAWRTLFLAGALTECPVLLTTSPDGGELLLAMYEKKTGRPAPLIAEIPLPAFVGWNSAEASLMVRDFSQKNGGLLDQLTENLTELTAEEDLEDLAATTEKYRKKFLSFAKTWEMALSHDFPAARYGRIPVTLNVLPSLSCSELLGKAQPAQGRPVNGILVSVG